MSIKWLGGLGVLGELVVIVLTEILNFGPIAITADPLLDEDAGLVSDESITETNDAGSIV